jgi:DnaJ domain
MKHTNSARGSDGQFARSDGPKAKRIEVWLQPQALDLLDTLCKQWGVGRGKAISHLICNGPVAPAAWVEVDSKPPPTPSAPPAGLKRVADLEDDPPEPPAPAPTTSDRPEPRFAIGDVVAFTTGTRQGQSFTIAEMMWATDHWRYGTGGGTGVAESVLELAPPPAPEPQPDPEPTPSGREPIDWEKFRVQDPNWEIHQADAKALGIRGFAADKVRAFKARHKLPQGQRLTPEAQQLVRDELEQEQRQTGARERVQAERLALINQATPNLFADLADRCGSVELSDGKVAIDYLLRRLPDLGLKPYRRLCAGLWQQLAQAVQWADLKSEHLNSIPARRALFWGVVLRLDHLGTDVPTDSDRFLEWCQFTVHQEHANRREDHQAGKLMDLLTDRLTTDRAREILGLPPAGTDLTRKAINDAYRDLARQHHPDQGGDATRFQRITEARERLLLALGG